MVDYLQRVCHPCFMQKGSGLATILKAGQGRSAALSRWGGSVALVVVTGEAYNESRGPTTKIRRPIAVLTEGGDGGESGRGEYNKNRSLAIVGITNVHDTLISCRCANQVGRDCWAKSCASHRTWLHTICCVCVGFHFGVSAICRDLYCCWFHMPI